jgi:hypothetical protein
MKSASKRFVTAYFIIMGVVTAAYIVLAYIAVFKGYDGSLYWLQWPITALNASGAVIMQGYFNKAKAENTSGGIVYDTAFKEDSI